MFRPLLSHLQGELFVRSKPELLFMMTTVATFIQLLNKVHPCTGTEALYRPYGP
jgi:hypothetical protein